MKTLDGDLDNDGTVDMTPYTQAGGAIGIQMLEQAYAIAKFASEQDADIDDIDIDNAIAYIGEGGFQAWAYKDVLGLDAVWLADVSDSLADFWAELGDPLSDEDK